jgi:hypothetical protein
VRAHGELRPERLHAERGDDRHGECAAHHDPPDERPPVDSDMIENLALELVV